MSALFLSVQCVLAAVALIAVAERSRLLLFRAPVSPALARKLSESLAAGPEGLAVAMASETPDRWASRIVIEASAAEASARAERAATCLADLRSEAEARLGLIRVSATLASTLGLLGGILAIQRGFSGHGLLSLRAGLAQQVALSEALTHMAVGIGTAAFCFAAFGLLRRAARDVLGQATLVAGRFGVGELGRGRRA